MYRARDTRLNRLVAIKVLPCASLADNDRLNGSSRKRTPLRPSTTPTSSRSISSAPTKGRPIWSQNCWKATPSASS